MTLFFYSWFADFLLLRTQRLDCWNCFEISGSIVWCLALQWRIQVSVYMYPWNVYGYIPVCILCIIIALTCSIICLVIQECSWIYMYVLAEAFIYGNIFIWCPFFFHCYLCFFQWFGQESGMTEYVRLRPNHRCWSPKNTSDLSYSTVWLSVTTQ